MVGGGPAGAIAALVLARAGRRVLLADRSGARTAHRRSAAAGRASTAPRSRSAAAGHGGRAPDRASPTRRRGDPAIFAVHDFIFDVHGAGLHLDRARFDASLREAAAAAGAEVIAGARVHVRRGSARPEPGRRARASRRIRSRGPSSSRRPRRGDWMPLDRGRVRSRRDRRDRTRRHAARRRPPGRRLRAPRAGSAPDRDSRTLIEACADGWWYSALLPSRERIVAFFSDSDLAGASSAAVARRTRPLGRHRAHQASARLLTASGYVMTGLLVAPTPRAAGSTRSWGATGSRPAMPRSPSIRCRRKGSSTRCIRECRQVERWTRRWRATTARSPRMPLASRRSIVTIATISPRPTRWRRDGPTIRFGGAGVAADPRGSDRSTVPPIRQHLNSTAL